MGLVFLAFNFLILQGAGGLSWGRTPCEDCCQSKIVGGEKTDIRKIPYQASLQFEGRNFCGGSVVTDQHIITAAHCVVLFVYFCKKFGPEGKLLVRVGSNHTDKGGVVSKVKRLRCHPKFDFDDYDYDICIIELNKKLKFSDVIRPVKIANVEPEGGEIGVVAGWGTLSENGKEPDHLHSVNVLISNKTSCEDAYATISPITKRMICAGTEGKDSCQGDSGGGLVVDNVLVGISSTGFGCGVDSYPGVYTSIAHPDIRKYIKKIIRI